MPLVYKKKDFLNILKLNNIKISEEDIAKIDALPSRVKLHSKEVKEIPYYTITSYNSCDMKRSPMFRIMVRGVRNVYTGETLYEKYSILLFCMFYDNLACHAEIFCDKEDLTESQFLFKYAMSKYDAFSCGGRFSVYKDSVPLSIEEIRRYVSPFSNKLYNSDWKARSRVFD